MEYAAGVDFGGTSAKIGLVDRSGVVLQRAEVAMDPREAYEGLLRPVADHLRTMVGRQAGRLLTVGIGTPGFIDKRRGLIIGGCVNLPALQGRSVQEYLGPALGVPAFSENDATSAAAGELAFGAGRRFSHFALITIGTAIGGGLVLDGKVYRGSRGLAGELGHLCMVPEGLWCNCGSRGCFEQYASATAISRLYAEKARKRQDPSDTTPQPLIGTREIVERARGGEAIARDTLEEAGQWIAQAFGTLMNALDLQACLVGGGFSQAGEAILEPIRRHLPDHCWPQVGQGVQVLAAELANDAGILGAAAQAMERLGA